MTDLLSGTDDKRVLRTIAEGERRHRETEARIAADKATAELRLRVEQEKLRLASQRDEVEASRRERRRQERAAARAEKRESSKARREELAARVTRTVEYVRRNAAATYSSLIYGLAVSGAVYGQVDAAVQQDLPTAIGIISAAAIEGTGLAMALTALEQRLEGERALAARLLVWGATGAAVGINYFGHENEPVKAIGLSVLSAIGIIVYEVRSAAKHRKALRANGVIPPPPERYGWRRWVVAPRVTRRAWALDVRDKLTPGAAALVEKAEAERKAQEVAALDREVAKRARAAAEKAAKKGAGQEALAALMRLANTGALAIALSEAEAAKTRAAEAEATAQKAQAEAEATARKAEAEAEAARTAKQEAEAVAARTEAEAAERIGRTEAEAAERIARTEAEAAERIRRTEAEAADRIGQAEAEVARLTEAVRRTEATGAAATREAAQAVEQRGRTAADAQHWRERAEQLAAALRSAEQQTVGIEAARQDAEVRAATAQGLLDREREERAGLEAQVARLAEQLREATAARPGTRTRKTPTDPKPAADPIVVDGLPAPKVKGVGAETVTAVMRVLKEDPTAGPTAIANQVKVSVRAVSSVLKALKALQPGEGGSDAEPEGDEQRDSGAQVDAPELAEVTA